MNQELFKIYSNKMVVVDQNNPCYNNEKYYYFYADEVVIGIEKSISNNEYCLIKAFYLEKVFHYDNIKSQNIYEYLFEKGDYPFDKTKAHFLIYQSCEKNEMINDFLQEYYGPLDIIEYQDLIVVFHFTFFEDNLDEMLKALEDDLGLSLCAHTGFIIDDKTKGKDISDYLKIYAQTPGIKVKHYSSIVDLVLSVSRIDTERLYEIIKSNLLDKVLTNHRDIIECFFQNELNVSKTAKALYLHRNSLINRLEIISRYLGFSIQNFRNACVVLMVMSYYQNG